ncbi:hypothetical protein GCM10009826_24480 [Humibacillus xanthopallidus]
MPADELDAQDAALLERLGAIARTVDPVPEHVVELGKAAFGFRDPDHELMQLVSRPVDAGLVRSSSATSHLHFFEHGDVALDLEVTVRGGLASVVGVIGVTGAAAATESAGVTGTSGLEGLAVTVETTDSSSAPEVLEGRFTVARLPVGLVRIVVRRDDGPGLSTGWFDIG